MMAQPQPQMPHLQMPQLQQMPPIPPQMSPQLPSQMQHQQHPQQQHQQHQQQQQQHPQHQQRATFSPTQHSPSPATTPQPGYAMPPNKRPRTDGGPMVQQQQQQQQQHPQNPQQQPQHHQQHTYHAQSFAVSPQAQAPPVSVASPTYINSPTTMTPQSYSSPYGNGGPPHLTMPTPTTTTTPMATPVLHLPEAPRQAYTPSPSTPAGPPTPNQQYTNATMMPIAPPPPPAHGVMGPPSKPAERPTKEYEYDVSDSLAGTGIDLRAEEQALADYYAGSFAQEAKTGLPANALGAKAAVYGSGWANQPAENAEGQAQEQFAAEAAKRAWDEAAQRLAVARSNEMREPFLEVPPLHYRAEKIAKEHGISLNLDLKNAGSMGKFKHPLDFPQPKVTVSTRVGPDGAMVSTSGSWIPHDAYLADQLALLSIASKHRLRELIAEACNVAVIRQTTSNGEVPEEWADVAVPLQVGLASLPEPESAVSPRSNPLKRSFDAANAPSSKPGANRQANHMTRSMRDLGEGDRKVEDSRMKKRQKRLNPETPAAGARSGSAAPGTPGSVAPEAELKAPTKKESKKGAAAKMSEASSTANANSTLNTMISGFGKKKGRQYSWMTGGGSGASTPNRLNTPGTPASAATVGAGAKTPQVARLTADGKTKWGTLRENIQGKNIQLRDWVTALEMERVDIESMQDAYMKLDTANAK